MPTYDPEVIFASYGEGLTQLCRDADEAFGSSEGVFEQVITPALGIENPIQRRIAFAEALFEKLKEGEFPNLIINETSNEPYTTLGNGQRAYNLNQINSVADQESADRFLRSLALNMDIIESNKPDTTDISINPIDSRLIGLFFPELRFSEAVLDRWDSISAIQGLSADEAKRAVQEHTYTRGFRYLAEITGDDKEGINLRAYLLFEAIRGCNGDIVRIAQRFKEIIANPNLYPEINLRNVHPRKPEQGWVDKIVINDSKRPYPQQYSLYIAPHLFDSQKPGAAELFIWALLQGLSEIHDEKTRSQSLPFQASVVTQALQLIIESAKQ